MKYRTPVLLALLLLPQLLSAQRDPFILIGRSLSDTIYWYAGGPPIRFGLYASPGATISAFGTVKLRARHKSRSEYLLEVDVPHPTPEGGTMPIQVSATIASRRATDQVEIVAYTPAIVQQYTEEGLQPWAGCSAQAGRPYDPSTHWLATRIPEYWYQTRVWFNDNLILDRPGTRFTNALSREETYHLTPSVGTKIRTIVFFKPGGTPVESDWMPLLSTDSSVPAVIHPCSGVVVEGDGVEVSPARLSSIRYSQYRSMPDVEDEDAPRDSSPVLMIEAPLDGTIYWYIGVPLRLFFLASNGAEIDVPGVLDTLERNARMTRYSFSLPMWGNGLGSFLAHGAAICAGTGEYRYCDHVKIVADTPRLAGASRGVPWTGASAHVGKPYDPRTYWAGNGFPENWYQTRVWFNNRLAFDKPGTRFTDALSENDIRKLIVPVKAQIRTAVYFRPYGTLDEKMWTRLLDTDTTMPAVVHPCKGVEVME